MFTQSKSKSKWSSDPQNMSWVSNESNFGFKMLEKMGWKKGKGLGQNENGLLEPVKINSVSDKKGVGCKASYDDTWISHQEDFASLLKQLNNNSPECVSKPVSDGVIGLEKTSKTQKRIHYKKFAKGKDLSNYNNTDMIGIFGKKRSKSDSSEKSSDLVNDCKSKKMKKENEVKEDNSDDNSSFLNFKVSKYNVHEYFKQRSSTLNCTEKKSQSTPDNHVIEKVKDDVESNVSIKKKSKSKSKKSKLKKKNKQSKVAIKT